MTFGRDDATPGPFAASARDRGGAALTRARLLDAAAAVLAQGGLESVREDEIARAAGVDEPALREHFADLEAIARAVAMQIAAAVLAQVAEASLELGDAAQRIAAGTRRFVELAAERPEWGRTLLRCFPLFPELREQIYAGLRADIERGVAHGMFSARIDPLLVAALAAMTLSALHARLDGAGPDCGRRVAELQLRALGIAPAAAEALAWKVIPLSALAPRFL